MGDVELQLPPDVRYIGLARLVVTTAARQAGMIAERVEDLRIAVSEATTNAVKAHRRNDEPSPVHLTFGVTGSGQFAVTIADAGPGFDPAPPEASSTREWTSESGLGVTLIRNLADVVEFQRDQGMVVRMRFEVDMPDDEGQQRAGFGGS